MNKRILRINEFLRQEISKLIFTEFSPEFGILTITAVETSPDLQSAKVYISVLNTGNTVSEQVLALKLKEKTPYLQKIIGQRLSMKYTPKLNFVFDHSQEKINRVQELLDKISKE